MRMVLLVSAMLTLVAATPPPVQPASHVEEQTITLVPAQAVPDQVKDLVQFAAMPEVMPLEIRNVSTINVSSLFLPKQRTHQALSRFQLASRYLGRVQEQGVIVAGPLRNRCKYGEPAQYTVSYDAPDGDSIGNKCFTLDVKLNL